MMDSANSPQVDSANSPQVDSANSPQVDSAGSSRTAARYWEWVLFTGLFGVIALYPFSSTTIPFVVARPALFMLALACGAAIFAALFLYCQRIAHNRWRIVITAGSIVAATVLLSIFLQSVSPVTAIWFIDAFIALFALGYCAAHRLLRRVERDMQRRWHYVVMLAFAANLLLVTFAAMLVFFPLIFSIITVTVFFLATALNDNLSLTG